MGKPESRRSYRSQVLPNEGGDDGVEQPGAAMIVGEDELNHIIGPREEEAEA